VTRWHNNVRYSRPSPEPAPPRGRAAGQAGYARTGNAFRTRLSALRRLVARKQLPKLDRHERVLGGLRAAACRRYLFATLPGCLPAYWPFVGVLRSVNNVGTTAVEPEGRARHTASAAWRVHAHRAYAGCSTMVQALRAQVSLNETSEGDQRLRSPCQRRRRLRVAVEGQQGRWEGLQGWGAGAAGAGGFCCPLHVLGAGCVWGGGVCLLRLPTCRARKASSPSPPGTTADAFPRWDARLEETGSERAGRLAVVPRAQQLAAASDGVSGSQATPLWGTSCWQEALGRLPGRLP
jgi:hypothetical protein